MNSPLITLESSQPANINQSPRAKPTLGSKAGDVYANGKVGTLLVLGRAADSVDTNRLMESFPTVLHAVYGGPPRSLEQIRRDGGKALIGLSDAPLAAVQLAFQPEWDIHSTACQKAMTNLLWHCACVQIRGGDSKYHRDFGEGGRRLIASSLSAHGTERIADITARWDSLQDRPLDFLQRVVADQLMVGGRVGFTHPALCDRLAQSPEFTVEPARERGGELLVVAVNDPDRPGQRIDGPREAWLPAVRVKTATVNPYALTPNEPERSATLNA